MQEFTFKAYFIIFSWIESRSYFQTLLFSLWLEIIMNLQDKYKI